MKYHEFFDANGRMVIADIGHFESEQFTIDLLAEILEQKFRNFAVLKTKIQTNPVHYFVGWNKGWSLSPEPTLQTRKKHKL